MQQPEVRVGQLWQDNDKRINPQRRFVRVVAVGDPGPYGVRVVSWYERKKDDGSWVAVSPERPSTINIRRFKPVSTGYRLIQEAS